MPESALDRVCRLTSGQPDLPALERVELATQVVHRHRRRNNKTGKTEEVRTYIRHTEHVGNLGAKKGVFANAPSAPSAPSAPKKAAAKKPAPRHAAPPSAPIRSVGNVAPPRSAPKRAAPKRAAPKKTAPIVSVGARYKKNVAEERDRAKVHKQLVENGFWMKPEEQQPLFDALGLTPHHKGLDANQLGLRLMQAEREGNADEVASLREDMVNVSKVSAINLAMMQHAERQMKAANHDHAAWDDAIRSFGKPGEALLKVRDQLMGTKAAKRLAKSKEAIKAFGKDVGWRSAEVLLAEWATGTVGVVAAHVVGAAAGAAVGGVLLNPVAGIVTGALVSAGMSAALKVAKKHSGSLARAVAEEKRARAVAAAVSIFDRLVSEGLVST